MDKGEENIQKDPQQKMYIKVYPKNLIENMRGFVLTYILCVLDIHHQRDLRFVHVYFLCIVKNIYICMTT